jgi:TRAP-type mannitol/chloroaromatic compound transport system permease small subunit
LSFRRPRAIIKLGWNTPFGHKRPGQQQRAVRSAAARSRDGTVQGLLKLSRGIDALNGRIGKIVAWLILIVVLVSALNATVRKLFDTSSNSWLELQWVLFGIVFLLCSPWTLLSNEHVRIDIVNNMLPKGVRNAIELFGHIFFLLPLTIIMMVTSVPFFMRSFRINEQSMNAGGLPQWPAKSLIMIGFALLFIQAISEIIKRLAIMGGLIADAHEGGGGVQSSIEAEAERVLSAVKTGPQ